MDVQGTGPAAQAGPHDTERALVGDMTRLATDFLDSLTPELHARALWAPLDDATVEAERVRWFYTPTDHGGVPLRELSPRQQSLAMQLLAGGLTRQAYVTACTVMGLENVLDEVDGWQADWGRERGRDPGLYWVRIFGRPGEPSRGWRFGGHHLSVNLLIRDGRIAAATPSFLGADPASSPLLAGTLRPLGGTEDLARTLMSSLPGPARAQALLHPRAISDIVSGNRARIGPGDRMMHMPDLFRGPLPTPRLAALVDRIDDIAETGSGYTEEDHAVMALAHEPQGVAAGEMTAEQRGLLRELLAAYTDRSPTPVADAHRRHYLDESNLDVVHFGWAGDVAPGEPHYYRLTAPRLLIEYDNTQRGANHAHSVWRDPSGDFGIDPLASHHTSIPH
ncbi:DUF3500 domain-containing protein [Saccharothrix deserti]|uniref:DUF3500 domain-containing protein n=1 Tax=Saccharothrix deserti TaxID=2593674 RepID=UPI00192E304F|nr:DUF3500 domain-containing protein [Saccharothrix deserti]